MSASTTIVKTDTRQSEFSLPTEPPLTLQRATEAASAVGKGLLLTLYKEKKKPEVQELFQTMSLKKISLAESLYLSIRSQTWAAVARATVAATMAILVAAELSSIGEYTWLASSSLTEEPKKATIIAMASLTKIHNLASLVKGSPCSSELSLAKYLTRTAMSLIRNVNLLIKKTRSVAFPISGGETVETDPEQFLPPYLLALAVTWLNPTRFRLVGRLQLPQIKEAKIWAATAAAAYSASMTLEELRNPQRDLTAGLQGAAMVATVAVKKTTKSINKMPKPIPFGIGLAVTAMLTASNISRIAVNLPALESPLK